MDGPSPCRVFEETNNLFGTPTTSSTPFNKEPCNRATQPTDDEHLPFQKTHANLQNAPTAPGSSPYIITAGPHPQKGSTPPGTHPNRTRSPNRSPSDVFLRPRQLRRFSRSGDATWPCPESLGSTGAETGSGIRRVPLANR